MATRRIAARDAYAIVRLDWSERAQDFAHEGSGPVISLGPVDVTIKEVVLELGEAEREVERLNRLNESKGCRYFWQGTRLFADSGSFGSGSLHQ
jgi:hypothetical protein